MTRSMISFKFMVNKDYTYRALRRQLCGARFYKGVRIINVKNSNNALVLHSIRTMKLNCLPDYYPNLHQRGWS